MQAHKGALLVLAMLLMLVVGGSALPFSGSPLINYGQRFYIYSDVWGSYCQLYIPGGMYAIRCDVGLTTPQEATKFYINGTGCGPVPSSAQITSSLVTDDGGAYCYVRQPAVNPGQFVSCESTYFSGYQFRFTNTVVQADGFLHGNATSVLISNISNGANGGICSAQPMWQDYGYVECNRPVASTWEMFNLVPA